MSDIRVLHIITVFSIGGATASMLSVAAEMKKRGYDVRIFTGLNVKSEGDLFDEASRLGIPVEIIPHLVKPVSPIRDILALFHIWRKISSGKYDIVHTHTAKAGILGRFAAKMAGVPCVFHTLQLLSFHSHQPKPLRSLFIALERLAMRFTDGVFSVSQAMIETHLRHRIGERQRYYRVYNCIRDVFFQDAFSEQRALKRKHGARFGFSENDVIVAKIARITKLKGQEFFVEIAARAREKNPNVKFLIVGGGENETSIKQLISKKRLTDVVFMTGVVSPAEIPEIIKMSDIIAMTSLHEGLPIVLQEAMALKKPIVSFDLDGAPEIIADGENGFLVKASPVDEITLNKFAEKILQLAADEALRSQMGSKSYEKVYPHFTVETMTTRILEVYERCLKRKSAK